MAERRFMEELSIGTPRLEDLRRHRLRVLEPHAPSAQHVDDAAAESDRGTYLLQLMRGFQDLAGMLA
jgi:hypothetical protein